MLTAIVYGLTHASNLVSQGAAKTWTDPVTMGALGLILITSVAPPGSLGKRRDDGDEAAPTSAAANGGTPMK